jgi:hypothetical protein
MYNTHTQNWQAAKRDNYFKLFSDIQSNKVLKSNSIDTLIYLVIKTDGKKSKLKEVLKNGK